MRGKEAEGARSLLLVISLGPGLEKVSNVLILSLRDRGRLAVEEVDLRLCAKGLVSPHDGFCSVDLGRSLW